MKSCLKILPFLLLFALVFAQKQYSIQNLSATFTLDDVDCDVSVVEEYTFLFSGGNFSVIHFPIMKSAVSVIDLKYVYGETATSPQTTVLSADTTTPANSKAAYDIEVQFLPVSGQVLIKLEYVIAKGLLKGANRDPRNVVLHNVFWRTNIDNLQTTFILPSTYSITSDDILVTNKDSRILQKTTEKVVLQTNGVPANTEFSTGISFPLQVSCPTTASASSIALRVLAIVLFACIGCCVCSVILALCCFCSRRSKSSAGHYNDNWESNSGGGDYGTVSSGDGGGDSGSGSGYAD